MNKALQPVPEGYKQTEMGIIPSDWDESTIGKVTIWSSGGTPNRKRGDFWVGDIPWISGSTLKSLEIFTSDQFLTREGVAAGSIMAPVNGTLLLVRGSALHNNIRAGLVILPVSFNQDVKCLFPIKSVLPKYLTLYIMGMESELLKLVSSAGNSAGVLDTELVKNFRFLKPNIKEQTAIANALSDVDALITSLEKLIAKKRAIKTAAMQQLLTGKKRLPPFGEGAHLSGKTKDDKQPNTSPYTKGTAPGYKQTELGEIPVDWEVVDLGAIGRFKNGINKDGDSFGHGDPLVNLMDVFGKTSVGAVESLGLIDSNEVDKKEYDLRAGDVLFIRSSVKPSGVGLTAVVKEDLGETVYSGFLIRYRSNANFDLSFKEHCFYESGFRKRIIAASSVSANTNINQGSLKKLLLIFPKSVDEQNAIASVLSDMDKEVSQIEIRLAKTRQLKQGMMQELLTGRTRLI